jgi:hypothetical protein
LLKLPRAERRNTSQEQSDSIDDMDLLQHSAMPALFLGIRVLSTLGRFCVPSPEEMCLNWRR